MGHGRLSPTRRLSSNPDGAVASHPRGLYHPYAGALLAGEDRRLGGTRPDPPCSQNRATEWPSEYCAACFQSRFSLLIPVRNRRLHLSATPLYYQRESGEPCLLAFTSSREPHPIRTPGRLLIQRPFQWSGHIIMVSSALEKSE
jgi:hypothetical protein